MYLKIEGRIINMTLKEELANCTSDEEKKELLKTILETLLKELKPDVQYLYANYNTSIPNSEEELLNKKIYMYIGTIVKSLSSDKDKLDILLIVTKAFCKAQRKSEMHTELDYDDAWRNALIERKNSFLNMKDSILKSISSFGDNDILNEIEELLNQLKSLVISEKDMDSRA